MKIGFIGTGVMGKSMAGHLIKAGYDLSIYTRTKSKAESLLSQGAKWFDTPCDLAENVDVIISIVGYPEDVEEIYLGDEGVMMTAREGQVIIDMSTSTPSLAVEIYEIAKKFGVQSLDAPVSGGDIGARDAKLTIMVGGDEDVFNKCKPIFEKMGTNIVHQGGPGAGQHTKMANQISIAGAVAGACEAIAYAENAGLDPVKVLQSVTAGSGNSWQLQNMGPRMINGDFAPGFYIKHFVKDMNIAQSEAEAMGIELPTLNTVESMYDELVEVGYDDLGTQALYKLWGK